MSSQEVSFGVTRSRVLIAEDDQGLRETTNDILTGEGYEVLEAANGEEALAVLAGSSVDVLILDLAMPRLNGVEVLRQIDPPPPVVIVHSALALFHEDDLRREAGHKLFCVLHKPVPPAELLSAVSRAAQNAGDP